MEDIKRYNITNIHVMIHSTKELPVSQSVCLYEDVTKLIADHKAVVETLQNKIEELEKELRAERHHRILLAINFVDSQNEGLNPLLHTQVMEDCEKLIAKGIK